MKASARKKKNRWIAHVELGYDKDGKRMQITKVPERNSETAALTLAQQLLADYLNNNFYAESKYTLSEFMEVWLSKHKNNISNNTYDFYKILMDKHIIPHLGHIKLSKLHSVDIQDMLDGLRDSTNLSNTTIRRIHTTLYTALEFANRHEIIPKNPSSNVRLPKQQKYIPVVLEEPELITLLRCLNNTTVFVPCMISIYSGLRRGEVCGLKWDNILLDKKLMLVKEQLQRVKGEGVKSINKTKTEDSIRKISISDELFKILIDCKEKQEFNKSQLGKYYKKGNYVCTFDDGTPLAPDYVTKKFKKIVEKAGFVGFRYHDLRHSFATLLISKGVDIKIISELLGHSSIRVTSDIYAHVLRPIQDEAVNKIKLDLSKKDRN